MSIIIFRKLIDLKVYKTFHFNIKQFHIELTIPCCKLIVTVIDTFFSSRINPSFESEIGDQINYWQHLSEFKAGILSELQLRIEMKIKKEKQFLNFLSMCINFFHPVRNRSMDIYKYFMFFFVYTLILITSSSLLYIIYIIMRFVTLITPLHIFKWIHIQDLSWLTNMNV